MPDSGSTSEKDISPLTAKDCIAVIEQSPDVIFIHVSGIIKYINAAGIKLLGEKSKEKIIGTSIWNIYPADVHGLVRTRIQQVVTANQMAPIIELGIKNLKNDNLIVECANIPTNYDGQPAVFVIMRDITSRKFQQALFNMQHSISSNLVTNVSMESAVNFSIKTICTAIHADQTRIWILDKKTNLLNCIGAWASSAILHTKDIYNILKPKAMLINDGFVEAFQTGETHWDSNLNENAVKDIEITKKIYRTLIVMPITCDSLVIGALEIYLIKSLPKHDLMLDMLKQTANQIGAYIKHKTAEKELIYVSNHDQVTDLINRHLFEQTLTTEIQLAANNDQKIALVFLDINNFRQINTTFGHASGDILLRQIAERIQSLGFSTDHTSRIENDQFAIIIHDAKSAAFVTKQIIEINSILSEKFQLLKESVNISVNTGISIYPDDGSNVVELMRSADIALTMAAQAGNGAFQFSTLELTDNAWEQLNLENSIRDALGNNEFYLVYQPIVDCKNMNTVGFEALLRWDKDGDSVPTETFIPILEKSGLFVIIGEWILRTACLQCKEWNDQINMPIYVSVNFSMSEFQNPNLLSTIENTLREVNLNNNLLTVELTESTLMHDKETGMQIANAIKSLGIKISIDDFGSGYSSLNYLVHVPMDYIKIDKVFIDDICKDPKVVPIVKAAIMLGENLNYQAIAEGVETKEQLDMLVALGCQYIQGFYFSKPMSGSDTMKFIKQGSLYVGE